MVCCISMFSFLLASGIILFSNPQLQSMGIFGSEKPVVLASKRMSLENRYRDTSVNTVFKDNILLTLGYMAGSGQIQAVVTKKPFTTQIELQPGDLFAFHDDVLPQYQGRVTKTTNAHFNFKEGFKSDGYLTGDGVCHLASLMDFVAKEARLDVVAPTRHDFAQIPDIPAQYGVSIYSSGEKSYANQMQNLYIKNNKEGAVVLKFEYDGKELATSVLEEKPATFFH